MSTPTAALPLNTLVLQLGKAGWADLDTHHNSGLRKVLDALVKLLPHGSAAGKLTSAQVADVAALSVKWTRHCLAELEALGLIEWRRGSIIKGRPQPGYVRVVKTVLAALARKARGYLDDRRTARRTATHERLQQLRCTHINNNRSRNPLSVHAELTSPLPFLKGGTRTVPSLKPRHQYPQGVDHMPTNQHGTPCITCGRTPERCEHANRIVPAPQRHAYTPSRPRSHQLIDPLTAPPSASPAPNGWRNPRHHQDALVQP